MKLIDVSHTIEHGLVTYRGLPAPIICDYLSREASRATYAPGTEFHIGKIELVANTGTYLDSPFHRYADGRDLSMLALEELAHLDTVVVDATRAGRAIGRELFSGRNLQGKAVLVRTDWSRHFRSDAYFEGHPFLTEDAAACLREGGVRLVGIDSLNIDDTGPRTRPVHSALLGADIPIVEHLTNLAELPESGATFFAVPVKIRGMGTFPVRAFAAV